MIEVYEVNANVLVDVCCDTFPLEKVVKELSCFSICLETLICQVVDFNLIFNRFLQDHLVLKEDKDGNLLTCYCISHLHLSLSRESNQQIEQERLQCALNGRKNYKTHLEIVKFSFSVKFSFKVSLAVRHLLILFFQCHDPYKTVVNEY